MKLLPPLTQTNDDIDSLLDTVHHVDAFALLARLPDASVDLIVTDPPYGIGYASSRMTHKGGGKRKGSGAFGKDELNTSWVSECGRVLKDGGAMYCFTRWDVLHHWHRAIDGAGLKVVQRIVWDKEIHGMGDLRYYGSRTEDCLFAVKGEHKLRVEKRPQAYWLINKTVEIECFDGYWGHPTQKPVRLIKTIIENSTDYFQVVCDPFVGSGTTALAARNTKRRYIVGDNGFDGKTGATWADITRDRLISDMTTPKRVKQENDLSGLPLFEYGA